MFKFKIKINLKGLFRFNHPKIKSQIKTRKQIILNYLILYKLKNIYKKKISIIFNRILILIKKN